MLAELTPVALRRRRVFETVDLDFTRDRISMVLQPHELLPGKSVVRHSNSPFYLDHIPVGRMSIGAICFGESHVHVPELADYHLFIMCLRGRATLSVDREEHFVDSCRGVLIAPGEELRASFSEDCEQLFVRIGRQAIADHSGMRLLQFRREVDLSSPRLGPWLQQVATIISDDQTTSFLDTLPRMAAEYERLLFSFLLAGQMHQDSAARNSSIAPASVRRAEVLHSLRLCRTAHIGGHCRGRRGASQNIARQLPAVRETSPIRYLRDVRLDAARQAMRDGTVRTAAEAATGSGLFHFGRFSQDYAERFGELPSQTLRQRAFS